MSDWFKDNLIGLLPPLYEHNDEAGDLRTFLSLPAGTLDELKQAIDDFPTIFDVDHCDERFLPLLARLVGLEVDGTCSPDCQRRRVREAVEIYRRKGTIPAIERDFDALGWQGELQETFRSALRLNARSKLSKAKLPGLVFSLGVFRVLCLNQTEGLRDALVFHHPAGTRCFWLQFLLEWIEGGAMLDFGHANAVRRIVLAFLDETFVLGRSSLGSCRHLTNKQRAWELLQLTSTTEMIPEIDRAAVKVSRFHGRQNRMRLNHKALNDWRLPYTRVGEDRVSFCTPIYTGRDFEGDVLESGFGLGESHLNRKPLTHGETALRYCFRQKDFFFDTQAEPVERASQVRPAPAPGIPAPPLLPAWPRQAQRRSRPHRQPGRHQQSAARLHRWLRRGRHPGRRPDRPMAAERACVPAQREHPEHPVSEQCESDRRTGLA